jgi:peroxiredoxin family protein
MEIEVFILVNAGHAFKKNAEINQMSDNTQTADEFNAELKRLNSSNWLELFEMSKELTDVTVHVCSLAGKIARAEQMEDFIDIVDDICGIGEYTTSSQEADVNLFI